MKALLWALAIFTVATLSAQSQQLVVDAANSSATAATKTVTTQVTKGGDSLGEAVKALSATKDANAELLRKQEAALQALDELQKEADQIRILSKRG